MRSLLWYTATIVGIISGGMQILTYFHMIDIAVIEKAGVLPRGVAEQVFLPPPSPKFNAAFELGKKAARNHKYAEAVENYRAALNSSDASESDRVKAYDAIGYAYFRAGDYDNAEQALNAALVLNPDAPLPRINLIKLMCARYNDPAAVRTAFDAFRILAPDYKHDGEFDRICKYAGVSLP